MQTASLAEPDVHRTWPGGSPRRADEQIEAEVLGLYFLSEPTTDLEHEHEHADRNAKCDGALAEVRFESVECCSHLGVERRALEWGDELLQAITMRPRIEASAGDSMPLLAHPA